MREVHDLASGMREAIASLKKTTVDAKNALNSEVDRAKVNASKVHSLAADLKSANLEVEDFLGESGSNFSPSEVLNTQEVDGPKGDINGVTLNKGVTK